MPELPDVEVFKRYMDATSLHQKIDKIQVKADGMVKGISAQKLPSRLKGSTFESSRRHAKYLFASYNRGEWLVLHFGMTGLLKYFKNTEKEPDHTRLLTTFLNGYHLAYDCRSKLGQIGLIPDPDPFIEEHHLGPDALDPNLETSLFREILAKRRGSIKSTLMSMPLGPSADATLIRDGPEALNENEAQNTWFHLWTKREWHRHNEATFLKGAGHVLYLNEIPEQPGP